jgi:hypothetical protein
MGRPIGSAAEWAGGVQNGGVVMMYGGSVRFKGGSIAGSKAVRDPRRWQLCVLHEYVAWGALYVAWCVMLVASCLLHRLLRTVRARLMLHGVQPMLHLGLQFECCMLYATCLGGQWDSSCCTGMLRVAWCRVYVVCLRVACCTLDAAQCKFRSLRPVFVTASLLLG